jgi:hypothetical protein
MSNSKKDTAKVAPAPLGASSLADEEIKIDNEAASGISKARAMGLHTTDHKSS